MLFRSGAPPEDAAPVPDAIRLDHATAGAGGVHLQPGPPLRVWIPPGYGHYGALIPIERRLPPGPCSIEAKFRLREGTVAFAFREKGKDDFLFSTGSFHAADITRDLFLSVPECGRMDEVMIRGYALQPSVVELERLVLWAKGK